MTEKEKEMLDVARKRVKKEMFEVVRKRAEFEWHKLLCYQCKYGSDSPEVKIQKFIWRSLDGLTTFLCADDD